MTRVPLRLRRGKAQTQTGQRTSPVYTDPTRFLSEGEIGMGDGNYMGEARADTGEGMCVPARGNIEPEQLALNSAQRRIRVVVENVIGQIKNWMVVGNGKFRDARDFEPTVFELCSKLTSRIMRVRNAYPRSNEWMWNELETWEAKLGVFLWFDYEDKESYLVDGLGADLLYQRNALSDAALLQTRWCEVWDMA